MFSFFKKKKDPFTVRIKEYEQPRFVAGMQTPTAKRSYRKDVSALQTSFNGKRDQLQNRTNPSGTMVIFSLPDSAGGFTYFVGDLVDTAQQADRPSAEDGQSKKIFLPHLAAKLRLQDAGRHRVLRAVRPPQQDRAALDGADLPAAVQAITVNPKNKNAQQRAAPDRTALWYVLFYFSVLSAESCSRRICSCTALVRSRLR